MNETQAIDGAIGLQFFWEESAFRSIPPAYGILRMESGKRPPEVLVSGLALDVKESRRTPVMVAPRSGRPGF